MRLLIGTMLASTLMTTGMAGAAPVGSGCPDGTVSTTASPDFSSFSFIFDQFIATAGGFGPATDAKSCTVDAQFPSTNGFGVYDVDRRGFVITNDGQTAVISDPAQGTLASFTEPTFSDYVVTTRVGTTPGNVPVVTTDINVDSGGSLDEVQATLDTLDIALVGFVTQESVQRSVNQLANQQAGITASLSASADLLLGFLDPIERPTEVNAFAAVGAPMIGATANLNFAEGMHVFGGISSFSLDEPGFSASGMIIAGGGRYIFPAGEGFDLFAEASVWGAPNADLRLSRTYQNLGADVTAGSSAQGSIAGINGRLGVVFRPDARNEIALSATASPTFSRITGYAETASDTGNLFAASINGQSVNINIVKASLAWTTEITNEVSATMAGAVGHAFGGSGPTANVAWVGQVTGQHQPISFVEYGAKLNWQATSDVSVSAFAFGTSGQNFGTDLRLGASLGVRF